MLITFLMSLVTRGMGVSVDLVCPDWLFTLYSQL